MMGFRAQKRRCRAWSGHLQFGVDERGELVAQVRRDPRLKPGLGAAVVASHDLRHFMQARDHLGLLVRDSEFDEFPNRPQRRG